MYYILIFSILTDPLAGLAGDLTHGQFLVVEILSPNNLIIYLKKKFTLFFLIGLHGKYFIDWRPVSDIFIIPPLLF